MKNIKAVLICLIGFLAGFEAKSQHQPFGTIWENAIESIYSININAGGSLSNLDYSGEGSDPAIEQDYVTGFYAGVTGEFYLIELFKTKLYLRTGLNYARKGYHFRGDTLINQENDKNTYDYLQIPINYAIYLVRNDAIDININGGLYLGLLVGTTDDSNYDDELTEFYFNKDLDFGLSGGAEIYSKLGSDLDIGLSYRYQYGLIRPFPSDSFFSSHFIGISLRSLLQD